MSLCSRRCVGRKLERRAEAEREKHLTTTAHTSFLQTGWVWPLMFGRWDSKDVTTSDPIKAIAEVNEQPERGPFPPTLPPTPALAQTLTGAPGSTPH